LKSSLQRGLFSFPRSWAVARLLCRDIRPRQDRADISKKAAPVRAADGGEKGDESCRV